MTQLRRAEIQTREIECRNCLEVARRRRQEPVTEDPLRLDSLPELRPDGAGAVPLRAVREPEDPDRADEHHDSEEHSTAAEPATETSRSAGNNVPLD